MTKAPSRTPVEVAAAVVGDAWSVLILREAVLLGTKKFVDFRTSLEVNRATLADRLDGLVNAELLARESASQSSDRTVYVPTESGLAYLPVLLSMLEWGRRWQVDEPGRSPLRVHHTPCGAVLSTALTCTHCSGPVDARSVDAERPANDLRRIAPDASQRMPKLDQLERGHRCPIARCLAGIGDRWSMLIIQEAFFGLHTFDGFSQRLAIASNTLSNRLSRLCDHGILDRAVERGRPFYRLTEKGLDLYGVPATTRQWAMEWLGAKDRTAMTHRWCGAELDVTVRCTHCGASVAPDDVRASWAS